MSRLEELRLELAEARRFWKWDRVREIELQMATERLRLQQAAASLPEAVRTEGAEKATTITESLEILTRGSVDAAATSKPPPATKPKSKKKTQPRKR